MMRLQVSLGHGGAPNHIEEVSSNIGDEVIVVGSGFQHPYRNLKSKGRPMSGTKSVRSSN